MKKTLYILACASIFSLLAQNAMAAASDVTQTGGAGAKVTIATTAINGAPDPLEFNPSTNVNMDGQSDATAFAIFGWHDQVEKKASGQAYGMASDENKLFFLDISSDLTDLEATAGTNAATAFADWTTI